MIFLPRLFFCGKTNKIIYIVLLSPLSLFLHQCKLIIIESTKYILFHKNSSFHSPLFVHFLNYSTLCCVCSTPITPNAANMCVDCIRSKVDITEGISRQVILQQCRGCERYIDSSHSSSHFLDISVLHGLPLPEIPRNSWLSVWRRWKAFLEFLVFDFHRLEVRQIGRCRVRLDRASLKENQDQDYNPKRSMNWICC